MENSGNIIIGGLAIYGAYALVTTRRE